MASKKTVSAKIIINSIDKDVEQKLANETDIRNKINLICEYLGYNKSSLEQLSFSFNETTVLIKWTSDSVNPQAESLHHQALEFARTGDIAKALHYWQKASQSNPQDPDYAFNIGISQYENKRFQDSIEELSRAIAICPIYYKAHLVLGTTYIKLRKYEFAKKHLFKMTLYNPTNFMALLNLGVICSILRQYEEGIDYFKRTIKINPNDPRSYLGIAKIYSTIGNTDEANENFKKVIELDKDGELSNYAKRSIVAVDNFSEKVLSKEQMNANPEELYSEAYRFFISGDYAASAEMYKKYLSIKPDDEYIWYTLGETLLRINSIEDAIDAFRHAIKFHPQKGLYYKELAIAFDRAEKYDKAIAATNKSIDLGKNDSVTYCILGKALYMTGKIDEAVQNLEKSIALNKNNLMAKYYLANAFIKRNESGSAIDILSEISESKILTPIKKLAEDLQNQLSAKQ